MKGIPFPVQIELHVKNELGVWINVYTYMVYKRSALFEKIKYIRSSYNLEDKDYEIFIIVKSKIQ
jgi:hypothetical protein